MSIRRFMLGIALGAGTVFAPALAGSPALPVVAPDSVTAAPHPYDETADAHADLAAALAEAKRTGKHVLIEYGGNWCPDCRVLGGIIGRPDVKPWLDAHYVNVAIDVGRRSKNLDLAERYGLKLEGVPTVLVLAADGTARNRDEVLALGDARSMVPQDVIALLARWCSEGPATN